MGILEVDKSKPIPKLAQDGIDENFTKKGVLEKKYRRHRKSGLGPSYFSFEKSWGPKLGLRWILEKYGVPLGAKLLHFPEGKWILRKTQDVFESLLHMVHFLQSSQKLRLASNKS